MIFSVAREFTDTPGPRYRKQGKFSGEEFRELFLEPLFKQYMLSGTKIEIDLDGVYGYPTSFLEEAFGGLVRKYHKHGILKRLKIVAFLIFSLRCLSITSLLMYSILPLLSL